VSAGRLVTVALAESAEAFDATEDEDDNNATPLDVVEGTSSSIFALFSALLLMDLDLSFVAPSLEVVLSCIAVSSSLDWWP
jgi:hypothetical protein